MMDELDVVQDVAARLDRHAIQYMLTGSMAMNFYAQPRMTRDVDFVLKAGPEDIAAIVKIFSPDYYVSEDAVRSSIQHRSLFNAIHNESIIKVDCIIQKNTGYRILEFERRRQIEVEGSQIWIASKEDLIISKLFWAKDSLSELQQRDVRNLVATGCDIAYVDRWAAELGLSEIWSKNK